MSFGGITQEETKGVRGKCLSRLYVCLGSACCKASVVHGAGHQSRMASISQSEDSVRCSQSNFQTSNPPGSSPSSLGPWFGTLSTTSWALHFDLYSIAKFDPLLTVKQALKVATSADQAAFSLCFPTKLF